MFLYRRVNTTQTKPNRMPTCDLKTLILHYQRMKKKKDNLKYASIIYASCHQSLQMSASI